MKHDTSREYYHKYYLNNQGKEVKIFLINGTIVRGVIVGVFHGGEFESYVFRWHVVPKEELWKYSAADEESHSGAFIEHRHVAAISWA